MALFKDFWKFCFKMPKKKYDLKIWRDTNRWFWMAVAAGFVWLSTLQLDKAILLVKLLK